MPSMRMVGCTPGTSHPWTTAATFASRAASKDMIIRGGENIYPSEVETALVEHAAVAESAVVAIPDQYWGEQVVAFVRLAPGATSTADELQSSLAQRLAAHKVPKGWYFVEAFPMNASGKILKTVLREQATRDIRS
jgi:fatty-acyl-CoA synthase